MGQPIMGKLVMNFGWVGGHMHASWVRVRESDQLSRYPETYYYE